MYAMSTETIETVPHFRADSEPAFLPLAPGVLYEFLELTEEGAPDEPADSWPRSSWNPDAPTRWW